MCDGRSIFGDDEYISCTKQVDSIYQLGESAETYVIENGSNELAVIIDWSRNAKLGRWIPVSISSYEACS